MQTIWKYKLTDPCTKIDMPIGAQVLTVQVQQDKLTYEENLVLWVLVDKGSSGSISRTFNVYGTGHDVPDNPGRYIGTVQLASTIISGALVFHVFESI